MSVKRRLILSLSLMLMVSAVLTVLMSVLLFGVFVIIYPETQVLFSQELLEFGPYTLRFVIIWCVGAILIFASMGTLVGFNIYKNIIVPVKELNKGIDHIKKGDLSYEFAGGGDKEIKELFLSFEELRLRLQLNVKQEIENEEARQQLLVNMSHDIKTPVTSIKGYIEGIKDGVAATEDMRYRYLNTIYSKADLIERLADNLSVYSKLEMGKMRYTMKDMDMREHLLKIGTEYEIDMQISGIELSYDIENCPLNCVGDYENLNRVFANIITNAIKYKKGEKDSLCISAQKDKAGIRISFADRGRGIPKEDLERIFDGFYRADTSRNSAIPGNGLGLSVCKRIIEDHGGRIWARNRKNGGSEFIMIIPERV